MSVDTSFISGILGSAAQRDATRQNAQNIRDTNALNYKMWQAARDNVMTNQFQGFEDALGKDIQSAYWGTKPDLGKLQTTVDQFKPMSQQAGSTAAGIFNGGVKQQMEQNFAPVKAARVAYTRQSALDSLNKTLQEINATQAGKGFSGDSYGNNLMRLASNRQAATDVAGVNLQNLTDERAIADQALQLKLNNLNLPNQMAANAIALQQMPDQAYLSQLESSMQPMTFFRIGGAQPFQAQPLPMVQPIAGAGQLAAQSVSGLQNAALQYWMNQQRGGGGSPYQPPNSTDPWGNPGGAGAGSSYAGSYDGSFDGSASSMTDMEPTSFGE